MVAIWPNITLGFSVAYYTIHKLERSPGILEWIITTSLTHVSFLCDIRPVCRHHFDAGGTSNAIFDE